MLAGRIAPAPMLAGYPHGETLGEWRALSSQEHGRRQSEHWAKGQADRFPLSWVGRLMARWSTRYRMAPAEANREHFNACRDIGAAQRAGLSPDANDSELCREAMACASEVGRRIDQLGQRMPSHWPEGVRLLLQYGEALHFIVGRGLELVGRGRIAPILARVRCDRWWRRVLRKMQARAIEATARALELVHKRAGCYVSDDGLQRRRGQVLRNAAALESVEAMNEKGQAYTLADLAARSTANREIRRHELMTRIAGFELIARECDHAAYFVTVTCPSRMHRMRTAGAGVEANPAFDGTTPDVAQRYLSTQWARFRAAAQRAGLGLYGFRIAEPNHDGTPHWHALLFFPPRCTGTMGRGTARRARQAYRVLVALLRRYFLLADSPNERGADRHRVKAERIDWTKGSAAGYVAKYVSKNIDGYKVERDLYGNDAITSSQRVEAWAATWRVRQFQQIGGAPVTIWRELRRLSPEHEAVAPPIALALEAVNITSSARDIDDAHDLEQRETMAHGWATYLHLQGGPRVPRRSLRYRLLRERTGELGRYGDPLPDKVVGVECMTLKAAPLQLVGWVNKLTQTGPLPLALEVESERSAWVIVPGQRGDDAAREKARERLRTALGRGEASPPWSPVNNCTRRGNAFSAIRVERHAKKGRWHRFERRAASPPTLQACDHDVDHSHARR